MRKDPGTDYQKGRLHTFNKANQTDSCHSVTVIRLQETGKHKVKVSLSLARRLASIALVTYLPTILMNLINQASNYITSDTKYDMIYTINITCMMVLASVYLSVSSSLPSTSDIKPVEVWLLFNLAYPVLVILTNVLTQVTRSNMLLYSKVFL